MTKTFLLIAIFLLLSNAQALTLYSPQVCLAHETLSIVNTSADDQPLWLQTAGDFGLEETLFVIPKKGQISLDSEQVPSNRYAIKVRTDLVQIQSLCGSQKIPWSPRVSSLRHWPLLPAADYKISIQNLNPQAQTIMLRWLSADRKIIETKTIQSKPYMESLQLKFSNSKLSQAVELEIEGAGRLSALLLQDFAQSKKWVQEKSPGKIKVPIQTNSHYFLMTNVDDSDSFIIEISDPAMLARARSILKSGDWKLLIADIEYGPLQENRSFHELSSMPYSWRVGQVVGFNDFAHISCDGSPQIVEERIHEWLNKKRICFWSYHLSRELSNLEVQTGRLITQP